MDPVAKFSHRIFCAYQPYILVYYVAFDPNLHISYHSSGGISYGTCRKENMRTY